MTVRVVQTLERTAETCFEAFCDVRTIPEWVHAVQVVDVRRRYPDGLPALVDFAALSDGGDRLAYALVYAYDRDGLRVTWRTEHSKAEGVRGYATFAAADEPGRCTMTYVLNYGEGWKGDLEADRRRADEVAAAFGTYIEAQL